MGTRFIATKEAPVHDNVKKAIVAASELDTRLIMAAAKYRARTGKSGGRAHSDRKNERWATNLKFEDIIEEVGGVYPRMMTEGDMDAGAWSCGMVAGLIHDIPTCKH